MGAIIEAFATTRPVIEVLGPNLILFLKNDEGNVAKVRKVHAQLAETDGARCATLRGLLEAEKSTGAHKPGGVLADPSAAIALLWMRRTLQFNCALLDRLCSSGTLTMAEAAREAYAKELEHYHNWLLRNTFNMALNAMPRREEFFARLAPRVLGAARRERLCVAEIRECVGHMQVIIGAMRKLYADLDLEDSRKA